MKSGTWKSLRVIPMLAVLGIIGWSSYTVVHYFRTSSRFEVKQFSISGLKRVDENQVFADTDLRTGANIFSVNLDEVRRHVENLRWVHHARVHRILPDVILIQVIEREPVGLARIGGEIYQFDSNAVVLEADALAAVSFPVLDGLRPNNRATNLRKVELYRRVIADLQGQTELSEIHINDAEEVSVVSASDPQLVDLGVGEFRSRWIKYLELKPEIQLKYPDAARIDLRFRNQVIVKMGAEESGEKVIWRAEKSSL